MAAVPDANLRDSTQRQQINLADEGFIERLQALAVPMCHNDPDIPKIQRQKAAHICPVAGKRREPGRCALPGAHGRGDQ